MNEMIMLSAPYTYQPLDDSIFELTMKATVEKRRHDQLLLFANHLMKEGLFVFAPLLYGFTLIQGGLDLPPTWEFWQGYCEASVRACRCVYVLDMEGWDSSTGVLGEIAEAKRQEKKVYLVSHRPEGPVKLLREL